MSDEKKSSRTPYLLISAILFILLGIVIIMFNQKINSLDLFETVFKWVVAAILGIIAAVNIIIFAKNTKENIKQLIFGIITLIAAILLVVAEFIGITNLLMLVVGIIFGLYLIVEGFFKIKAALDSKKSDVSKWFVPLIFGIVSIILGALIIFFGIKVTKWFVLVLGILLIYAGIQNVVNLFFGKKK